MPRPLLPLPCATGLSDLRARRTGACRSNLRWSRRRSRTTAGLAVTVIAVAVWGALPSNSSAGGASACLRLPQARVIENTDQAVVVRSRPRRAYYGCLKRQGRAIRIGSPDRVFDIGPIAGSFVAAQSNAGRKEFPGGTATRHWLILIDLRSGAEYRVFKSFFFEDCCGGIYGITLRDTGSVAFYSSGGREDKLHIYACELATCYDSRRYGTRLRDLDQSRGGFIDFRLEGDALRWTNGDDGQEKSAVLR